MAAYSAAKHPWSAWSRSVAGELADRGVAIAPSPRIPPAPRSCGRRPGALPPGAVEVHPAPADRTAARSVGVADAVAWLCFHRLPPPRWTGSVVAVDGGMTWSDVRFRADRSLRIPRPSRRKSGSPSSVALRCGCGGSPGQVKLVARLAAGDDVVVAAGSPTAALVDRLLDAGALHPDPTTLPSRCSPSDVTVVVGPVTVPARSTGCSRRSGPFRDAGAGLVVVDDGSVDGPALRAGVAAPRCHLHPPGPLRRSGIAATTASPR